MHSFQGKTCTIHYNADMSGEIVITTKAHRAMEDEVKIDIDDIIDFLAHAAREKAVQKLDEQYGGKSGREILGL